MTRLNEDSVGDKLFRFVLGALIGAGGAWFTALKWNIQGVRPFVELVAAYSLAIGGLAVVFGNALLESVIRRGREE